MKNYILIFSLMLMCFSASSQAVDSVMAAANTELLPNKTASASALKDIINKLNNRAKAVESKANTRVDSLKNAVGGKANSTDVATTYATKSEVITGLGDKATIAMLTAAQATSDNVVISASNPTTAAAKVGDKVIVTNVAGNSVMTWNGTAYEPDFVYGSVTPIVQSGFVDNRKATWKRSGLSVVASQNIEHKYANGRWIPTKPLTVFDFGAIPNDGVSDEAALMAFFNWSVTEGYNVATISSGLFHATHLDIPSGLSIQGNGIGQTQIKQLAHTSRYTESDGLININRNNDGGDLGEAGTTRKNITIKGLTLIGRVVEEGFDELKHTLHIHDASNVIVSECEFVAYQSDGVIFNRGNSVDGQAVAGQLQLAKNAYNVTVRDCLFNGVNRDNRNAIALVGVDGARIENNKIKNTTRFNMPGAIDVEPGWNFEKSANIIIKGNTIDSCGGLAAIVYQTHGADGEANQTLRRHSIISENYITNCFDASATITKAFYIVNTTPNFTKTNKSIGLVIEKNTVFNCEGLFTISSMNNVKIEKNHFEKTLYGATMNNFKNYFFEKNTFIEVSTIDTKGLEIIKGSGMYFIRNVFDSCMATSGYHFWMEYLETEKVEWRNNQFKKGSRNNFLVGDGQMWARGLANVQTFKMIDNEGDNYLMDFRAGTFPTEGLASEGVYSVATSPDQFLIGKISFVQKNDYTITGLLKNATIVTEKSSTLAANREFAVSQKTIIDGALYTRNATATNGWTNWFNESEKIYFFTTTLDNTTNNTILEEIELPKFLEGGKISNVSISIVGAQSNPTPVNVTMRTVGFDGVDQLQQIANYSLVANAVSMKQNEIKNWYIPSSSYHYIKITNADTGIAATPLLASNQRVKVTVTVKK
jgi:hypothetical protein